MRRDSSPQSTWPDHPVWQRLTAFTIGPDHAALSFAQRLARENGWSQSFADRVIEEYRRFCFLAVTGQGQVTPSDAVDQAWHLHLTYSRDYWQHFCPDVLCCDLHHGPTKGGQAESSRFFDQYAATLLRYEQTFGPPPVDIWPDGARRLLDDPRARRVHPRDGMVLRRITFAAWLIAALLMGIAIGWAFLGRTG